MLKLLIPLAIVALFAYQLAEAGTPDAREPQHVESRE